MNPTNYSASYIAGPVYYTPSIGIFCGKSKKTFKYTPKEDITNIELAHLLELMAVAAAGAGVHTQLNVVDYVEEHKLERHFQIT